MNKNIYNIGLLTNNNTSGNIRIRRGFRNSYFFETSDIIRDNIRRKTRIKAKERKEKMSAKDRVIAAIKGMDTDYVPSGFSLHFPQGCESGEQGVKAHLKFFKDTDMDICKIMNENLVPYCEGIRRGDDWSKIPSFDMDCPFMQQQVEMTKRILDKCDSDKFIIGTLHGAVASAIHPIEKDYGYGGSRLMMVNHFRQNRKKVYDAYKRIAEGMCRLAETYIELGLDGVYYAALGGEYRYYTDEEFARYIEPLDKQILKAIGDAKGYRFLHICKDDLNMERYKDYGEHADVINWGVYEAPFSLEQGRKMFPGKTIMGGLANRSGVLVEGEVSQIQEEVKEIIAGFGKKGFILGADCTLPTEIDYGRIRAAVEAARE